MAPLSHFTIAALAVVGAAAAPLPTTPSSSSLTTLQARGIGFIQDVLTHMFDNHPQFQDLGDSINFRNDIRNMVELEQSVKNGPSGKK